MRRRLCRIDRGVDGRVSRASSNTSHARKLFSFDLFNRRTVLEERVNRYNGLSKELH